MARPVQEEHLQAIERAVGRYPEGATARQIAAALEAAPPRRTLQYRVKYLVDSKRLVMLGGGRGARYRVPGIAAAVGTASGRFQARAGSDAQLPLSRQATDIQKYIRQPPEAPPRMSF